MSKCWYCNEELTTANYCDEHIGICTKCYGSMFKVSNEFVKGLTDKIADLEAKLAQKEFEHSRDLDRLNEELKSYKYAVGQMWELLNDNDKEIEDVKKWWSYQYEGEKQTHNQDKISFAVEQLEKVKELIKNMSIGIGIEIYGTRIKPVEEEIDNQIEELKKEMK